MQRLKFDAADKEAMERHAKACWNKLTRFLDKFTEITFMVCLTASGVWNVASMFVGDDKGFHLLRLVLGVYYLFMALLVYMSWTANIEFITYFGFMRSAVYKSFFLLFCACLTFPNKYSPKSYRTLTDIVAVVLCIAAALQLLKLFNKDEEKDMLTRNQQE